MNRESFHEFFAFSCINCNQYNDTHIRNNNVFKKEKRPIRWKFSGKLQ